MHTLLNYLLNIYASTRRLVSAAPTLVREFPCYSGQQSLQRFLLSQSAENKCWDLSSTPARLREHPEKEAEITQELGRTPVNVVLL